MPSQDERPPEMHETPPRGFRSAIGTSSPLRHCPDGYNNIPQMHIWESRPGATQAAGAAGETGPATTRRRATRARRSVTSTANPMAPSTAAKMAMISDDVPLVSVRTPPCPGRRRSGEFGSDTDRGRSCISDSFRRQTGVAPGGRGPTAPLPTVRVDPYCVRCGPFRRGRTERMPDAGAHPGTPRRSEAHRCPVKSNRF
jgi:hypothetical protein